MSEDNSKNPTSHKASSDEPPRGGVGKCLHDKTIAVENWCNTQREKLRGRNRYLYWLLIACVFLAPNVLANFISDFIKELPWRWIVKIVFFVAPFIFFLWLEIRAAKRKILQISWTGWVVATCIAIILGWEHLKHETNLVASDAPSPADVHSGNPRPIVPDFVMEKPGVSSLLHIGDTVAADFAGMFFKVMSISVGEPMALIGVTANHKTESIQMRPDNNYLICTNEDFVAQVASLDNSYNSQSLRIKIYKIGGTPQTIPDSQTQWYLHLKRLTLIPPSFKPPLGGFRIETDVNGYSYNSPNGIIVYSIRNHLDLNKDPSPLVYDSNGYMVHFKMLKRNDTDDSLTNVTAIASAQDDSFKVTGLPAERTNSFFVGGTRNQWLYVDYDITTNK